MSLLVHGGGLGVRQAASVNRMRRRAEGWCDVLIGGLLHVADLAEFAVSRERAEDFAADLACRRKMPGGECAWRLTLVSMRNAFQTGLSVVSANPDANARIAQHFAQQILFRGARTRVWRPRFYRSFRRLH